MSGGYQVNLGALSQLVTTLTNAAQSITNANTALSNASADELGNGFLNNAGNDFKNRWQYGTGKIADLTKTMTNALGATVQAYQDVENQVAQSFQGVLPQSAEPASGPPGPSNRRISDALSGGQPS